MWRAESTDRGSAKLPTSYEDTMGTNIVVQKYGGSSVADAEKIRLVAKRIARTRAEGKKVVVVVSAMGKTTNQLIEKAKLVSPSPSRRAATPKRR